MIVAVFFGGRSNEREISVITGLYCVNLLKSKVKVLPVYLPFEGGMTLAAGARLEDFRAPNFPAVRLEGRALVRKRKKYPFDCALNCCHGGAGEDGTLAALLRWNGVPSASPDMPVSAVFMDKTLTKFAAAGMQIPTAPSFWVDEAAWREREEVFARAEAFGYPVVVKPARLGSSIGVTVARTEEELSRALTLAFRLDSRALVERYFEQKRDINCAAYRRGGEIVLSPLEEVYSDGDILTFGEKYERAARTSDLPAVLPPETEQKICAYTRALYEGFGVRGVVRADFLLAGEEVYFNELNTVPGSLACYLFGETLTARRDFLLTLVGEAREEEKKEIVCADILRRYEGAKGCKRRGNIL